MAIRGLIHFLNLLLFYMYVHALSACMVLLESIRGVGSLELELQMIVSYLNCKLSHLSNPVHLNFFCITFVDI